MDDLLPEFLIEASENLAVIDVELVRFEQDPNDAAILQRHSGIQRKTETSPPQTERRVVVRRLGGNAPKGPTTIGRTLSRTAREQVVVALLVPKPVSISLFQPLPIIFA